MSQSDRSSTKKDYSSSDDDDYDEDTDEDYVYNDDYFYIVFMTLKGKKFHRKATIKTD